MESLPASLGLGVVVSCEVEVVWRMMRKLMAGCWYIGA